MLGQNENPLDFLPSEDLDAFLDQDDDEDDLFGQDEEATSSAKFARVRQWKAPRLCKYQFAQEAARDIGRLEEGDHVDMIVSGDFIAGDFIEAYLAENGITASEIIITTLSLSAENVDSLRNVKNQYCSGVMGLIISDYFFAMERRDGVQDIIEKLHGPDFFLAVAGLHTKITMIRTDCGMNLTIGGSANLRSSRNIEQITVDNNKAIYDFHREWTADILNQYQVKHKMMRRKQLWQQVAKAKAREKQAADTAPQESQTPKSA